MLEQMETRELMDAIEASKKSLKEQLNKEKVVLDYVENNTKAFSSSRPPLLSLARKIRALNS